jgi:hypothetical protein
MAQLLAAIGARLPSSSRSSASSQNALEILFWVAAMYVLVRIVTRPEPLDCVRCDFRSFLDWGVTTLCPEGDGRCPGALAPA